MSSKKVKKLFHELDFTSTYATGVLTVTTSSAHLLVTGDVVSLFTQNVPFELSGAVTVVDATSFTIASTKAIDFKVGKVRIEFFRTGFTGRVMFTAPRSTGAAAIAQSFVVGTGAATYALEGSLDGVHWTPIATVTHGATTNDTQSAQVAPNWTYLSVDISAVGAATTLTILYSA